MRYRVRAIFKSCSGKRECVAEQTFFGLGGDSLQAVECLSILEREYQFESSLESLLDRSAEDLADQILSTGKPKWRLCVRDVCRGLFTA